MQNLLSQTALSLSLPARGAWIEIIEFIVFPNLRHVAPRTGGVD